MVLVSPDFSDILAKPDMYVNRFTNEIASFIDTSDKGISHTEDLISEALAVGLSIVPVFWVASKMVQSLVPDYYVETRVLMSVALAGGAFHIISEESGVNNWFLTNSVAAKKAKKCSWEVMDGKSGCNGTDSCKKAKKKANNNKHFGHLQEPDMTSVSY